LFQLLSFLFFQKKEEEEKEEEERGGWGVDIGEALFRSLSLVCVAFSLSLLATVVVTQVDLTVSCWHFEL
jgi:hypothetical protein